MAECLRITAQKIPGGKAILRIHFYTGDKEGFSGYLEAFEQWERLKTEMERQGWIDLSQEKPAEQETLSEVRVCVVFERQFVGKPEDIEPRLDFCNWKILSAVHGPFVRVWVADKQADPLEIRFTLMGMARDELVEGNFGNFLIGEVNVLTHGNRVNEPGDLRPGRRVGWIWRFPGRWKYRRRIDCFRTAVFIFFHRGGCCGWDTALGW